MYHQVGCLLLPIYSYECCFDIFFHQDTEFPGTVYLPTNTENEFEYNVIKANCDNLKLIQFGISLANGKGEYPEGKTVGWQFNLEFDEK